MSLPDQKDLVFDKVIKYKYFNTALTPPPYFIDLELTGLRSPYFVNPYTNASYCICKQGDSYLVAMRSETSDDRLSKVCTTYDSSLTYIYNKLIECLVTI